MQSRTSYFNPTLFRKNVARFWPLWALYGVVWLVVLPLRGLNDLRQGAWSYTDGAWGFYRQLLDSADGGVALAVAFGLLAAMALFSYLYQGRSACMFHALPIRREGLFLTNYLSGLAFFLVPNTVVALLTLLVELMAGDVVLWALGAWWLITGGMCLFFFSFAVLLAMLTGHILALPAFYAIFNLLVLGLNTLLSGLLDMTLYGFAGLPVEGPVELLTPAYGIQQAAGWGYDSAGGLIMNSPGVFAGYVLAGLVMAVLALVLYRRRQVETAGDVVAVRWLRPVFKYGMALCSGLAFGMVTNAVIGLGAGPGLWVCIVLWTAVGCLAAEMLLRKSFRVLDSWKGAGAVTLAALVCCLCVEFDIPGFETRVPDPAAVESVVVSGPDSMPYDNGSSLSAQFTDPELIARTVALHQAIVDHRSDPWDGNWEVGGVSSVHFHVAYDLADGSRMERSYYANIFLDDLDTEGTVAQAAQALLDAPGMTGLLYGLEDLAGYTASSAGITVISDESGYNWQAVTGDSEQAQQLWDAVQADLAAGTLGRRYLFDTPERLNRCYYNDLTITLAVPAQDRDGNWYTRTRDFTVTLTTDAENTLAVLAQLGVSQENVLIPYGQVLYGSGTYDEYYDYPDSALWEKEQAETLWEQEGAVPQATPAAADLEPGGEALTTVAGVTAVRSAG